MLRVCSKIFSAFVMGYIARAKNLRQQIKFDIGKNLFCLKQLQQKKNIYCRPTKKNNILEPPLKILKIAMLQ